MTNKNNSKKRKRSYRHHVARSAVDRAKSDQRIRQELLDLRAEIEADSKAFRIDPLDYAFCKSQIENQLGLLATPRKPGELRVVGLPNKQVDWEKLKQLADDSTVGRQPPADAPLPRMSR